MKQIRKRHIAGLCRGIMLFILLSEVSQRKRSSPLIVTGSQVESKAERVALLDLVGCGREDLSLRKILLSIRKKGVRAF